MLPAKISCVEEMEKDLHKLRRIGLEKDLELFKQALSAEPQKLPGIFRLQNIGEDHFPVYKVKKFRCKALNRGTESGIRVIYTYDPNKNEILLIEIYYKEDKKDNDMERAKRYAIKKPVS